MVSLKACRHDKPVPKKTDDLHDPKLVGGSFGELLKRAPKAQGSESRPPRDVSVVGVSSKKEVFDPNPTDHLMGRFFPDGRKQGSIHSALRSTKLFRDIAKLISEETINFESIELALASVL